MKTVSERLLEHRQWLFELEGLVLRLGHRQLSEEVRDQYRLLLGMQNEVSGMEIERECLKSKLEVERSDRNRERSMTGLDWGALPTEWRGEKD